MSIESDAQKDLALSDDDAEGVVGGKKHAKKQMHKAATHAAAAGSVSYSYSPTPAGTVTSDSGSMADEDCDQPGYAGSTDTSSPA